MLISQLSKICQEAHQLLLWFLYYLDHLCFAFGQLVNLSIICSYFGWQKIRICLVQITKFLQNFQSTEKISSKCLNCCNCMTSFVHKGNLQHQPLVGRPHIVKFYSVYYSIFISLFRHKVNVRILVFRQVVGKDFGVD